MEVFNKKESRPINEYKKLICDLKNQVTRLSDIVKTLLNLTNEDSIQEKEYVYVSDILETIVSEFSNIAKEKTSIFL